MVTYADRASYCGRVVERLIEAGVNRIIIVDNASCERSRTTLEALASRFARVALLVNDSNLGAAGGFIRGFEAAFAGDEEFVFLLDDDNLPHEDCLQRLVTAHRLLEPDESGILLYANRGSTRETDMRAFRGGYTKAYLPNSFCTFDIRERAIDRLKLLMPTRSTSAINYPVVRVHYGPYGGMFGRRELFAGVGMPRADYFLYADDHDYAMRMDRHQIAQFLVEPARIEDLDVSFAPGSHLLSESLSEMRVYYQMRNHTHLSQPTIRSRAIYNINKNSFLVWEFVKGRRAWLRRPLRTMSRWRLVRRAISDGEAGRLGRSYAE